MSRFFKLNIIIYISIQTATAKSLQSCPTLCDPVDGSPPGSPVSGILQARTLEWVAISFSNAWKTKVKVKSLSHVRPSATPWTAAYQAPPSMGFSRQEYWSGVPLPSPFYSKVTAILLSHFCFVFTETACCPMMLCFEMLNLWDRLICPTPWLCWFHLVDWTNTGLLPHSDLSKEKICTYIILRIWFMVFGFFSVFHQNFRTLTLLNLVA